MLWPWGRGLQWGGRSKIAEKSQQSSMNFPDLTLETVHVAHAPCACTVGYGRVHLLYTTTPPKRTCAQRCIGTSNGTIRHLHDAIGTAFALRAML